MRGDKIGDERKKKRAGKKKKGKRHEGKKDDSFSRRRRSPSPSLGGLCLLPLLFLRLRRRSCSRGLLNRQMRDRGDPLDARGLPRRQLRPQRHRGRGGGGREGVGGGRGERGRMRRGDLPAAAAQQGDLKGPDGADLFEDDRDRRSERSRRRRRRRRRGRRRRGRGRRRRARHFRHDGAEPLHPGLEAATLAVLYLDDRAAPKRLARSGGSGGASYARRGCSDRGEARQKASDHVSSSACFLIAEAERMHVPSRVRLCLYNL